MAAPGARAAKGVAMGVGRKLSLIGIPLVFSTAAAQSPQAPDQEIMVAIADGARAEALAAARQESGVTFVRRLPSINAEIWRVRAPNMRDAITRMTQLPGVDGAERATGDYRNLFSFDTGQEDITPEQAAALSAVRARPELADVRVARLRTGEISQRMLYGGLNFTDSLPVDGSIRLNLAPETVATVVRRDIRISGPETLLWSGTVADTKGVALEDAENVALIVREDRISGTATIGGQTYSIRPLGGGLHAIARIDYARLPPEHESEEPLVPSEDLPSAQDDAPPPPAAVTLSVGVLVTPEAERLMRQGGATPEEFLDLAVLESNQGFDTSHVPVQFTLAGWRAASYSETPDFASILRALLAPADGSLDDVVPWRSSIHADFVVMIVAANNSCGRAAGFHVPHDATYAVVSFSCATGNYSFAHEIGHLIGARHDPDTDAASTPFAWGHGFRYRDQWRTIMAYPGGSCGSCPRINAWASPDIKWQDVPMGTPELNDDARVIRENAWRYASS